MTEIFKNIPEEVKKQARFWADMALLQPNFLDGAKMMSEYVNSCKNEEEREFVDFYFKMRMEKINER